MASSVIGALRVILGMNAGEFDKGAKRAGSAMDRLAKKAERLGVALGAAFATTRVFGFLRDSVNAWGVQEQAIAAVEAVLRTTGGTAGFTSKQLQKVASELQETSKFGDEDILKQVTGNLLTFGNIVGPVFLRAQAAALDLSETLKQSMMSAQINTSVSWIG